MLSQARTLRSWSVFVQLMLEETVADVQKRHCPTTPFDRASAIRASVSAWTLAMGLCNREIISLHVNDNGRPPVSAECFARILLFPDTITAPFNLLCTWLEEIAIHIAHELIEQDDTQEDVASQQTPGSSLSQTRLIALVEPLNVNTQ